MNIRRFPLYSTVLASLGVLAAAVTLSAPSALAANDTWTGASSADFFDGGNWSPSFPSSSDVGVFTGAVTTNQPTLSANGGALGGLAFSTPTGGWTLGGSSFVLGIGSSGIDASLQTSGTNTISAGLQLTSAQNWNVGSGGLVVSGPVSSVDATDLLTLNGAGSYTLSGVNTFTGGLTVGSNATVIVSNASSLGASSGTVTFNSGATLENGAGSAVTLGASNYVITGTLNVANISAALLTSGASTASLNAGTGLVTRQINLNTVNNFSLSALVTDGGSGTANLIVNGNASGARTSFSMSNANNSFKGALTLEGNVQDNGYNLANGGVASSIGAGGTAASNLVIDNAILRLQSGGSTNRLFTIGAGGATIEADGAVAVNFTGTGGSVAYIGTSATGTRSLTLDGSSVVSNTFALTLANPAGEVLALTIGNGAASNWVITANNTFTGVTTVASGTLTIGDGHTTGNVGGNVALSTASTVLDFNHSNGYDFNGAVSGAGKVVQNSSGGVAMISNNNTYTGGTVVTAGGFTLGDNNGTTGSIAGNVSVAAAGSFGVYRSNAYTFGGTISGAGVFRNDGTGTTTLSANNTYTGATQVLAGTLLISGSLSASTAVTVGSGSTSNVAASFGIGKSAGAASFATLNVASMTLTGTAGTLESLRLSLGNTGISDKIVTTGSITLTGVNAINLLLTLDTGASLTGNYTLLTWGAGSGVLPGQVTLDTNSSSAISAALGNGSYAFQDVGNSLELVAQAVPEPSTWALFGCGLVVAAWTWNGKYSRKRLKAIYRFEAKK